MRRTVIIAPGLVGEPDGDSVLRQKLPSLERLAEIGTVSWLAPMPPLETPEALYLGMSPSEAQMAQGPLTVSALGADPPERSTHFHLSLLSLEGESVNPGLFRDQEGSESIWKAAQRLNTRSLTLLKGEGVDHGLVWEGLGDMLTWSPENGPLTLPDHLPQGDAENPLRRLIDDSVNLLNELEFNRRRMDAGLPPFNVLWPWGHGRRVSVPNLALRRGEPAVVESPSLRLHGLTRLAGYSHVDRSLVGRGMKTRLADIAKRCLGRPLSIVVIEGVQELRTLVHMEELEWLVRELDRDLLTPLLDDVVTEKSLLTLLSPSALLGLGVTSATHSERSLTFNERTLEEKRVSVLSVAEGVLSAVL